MSYHHGDQSGWIHALTQSLSYHHGDHLCLYGDLQAGQDVMHHLVHCGMCHQSQESVEPHHRILQTEADPVTKEGMKTNYNLS
jgi:hypothetical protein